MEYPNLDVREFAQAVANFCNQSPLPAEVKRLCLRDLSVQLETESNRPCWRNLQNARRVRRRVRSRGGGFYAESVYPD